MRRLMGCALAAMVLAATPVRADNPAPYPGTVMVPTGKPFDAYVEDLRSAVKAGGLGIVAEACAHCGAEKIGVTIPGNRVIMVFAPPYAVRMLAASTAAGIEAPLRLYVTERADGTATLTYRTPSSVFGVYENVQLDAMAAELDTKFEAIVKESITSP